MCFCWIYPTLVLTPYTGTAFALHTSPQPLTANRSGRIPNGIDAHPSSHLSNSHGHAHAANVAIWLRTCPFRIPPICCLCCLPMTQHTPHQADDPQHLIAHHYDPAEPHDLWPTVLPLGQPVVRAASCTTRGSYIPSTSRSTPSTTSSASCSASRMRISLPPNSRLS